MLHSSWIAGVYLLTLSAHAQRVTVVVESVSLSVCNAKLTEAAAAFLHLKQVST